MGDMVAAHITTNMCGSYPQYQRTSPDRFLVDHARKGVRSDIRCTVGRIPDVAYDDGGRIEYDRGLGGQGTSPGIQHIPSFGNVLDDMCNLLGRYGNHIAKRKIRLLRRRGAGHRAESAGVQGGDTNGTVTCLVKLGLSSLHGNLVVQNLKGLDNDGMILLDMPIEKLSILNAYIRLYIYENSRFVS